VTKALEIRIYFAKPYHSGERGANENLNGLYRQYIPKGTDFSTLDKEALLLSGILINTRSRKRLNFFLRFKKFIVFLRTTLNSKLYSTKLN
jgi:IS30 family transposase